MSKDGIQGAPSSFSRAIARCASTHEKKALPPQGEGLEDLAGVARRPYPTCLLRRKNRAAPARAANSRITPRVLSVGTWVMSDPTTKLVGLLAPVAPGSSVVAAASLMPLPS